MITPNEITIAVGAILTTWILNNTKLKDGLTDWFVNTLGIDNFNIENHTVKEVIKELSFDAHSTNFRNYIKTELYIYYVSVVLNNMNDLIVEITSKQKKLSLNETKKLIKNLMYDKLSKISNEIDENVKMPKMLQDKFDNFKNYLALQHTHAIENALQANTKKLLLLLVFDAIEINARWFLFYTKEMFHNFNGAFDQLEIKDVFNKH